ncbi:MAG: beta-ketoacyl synthase N-terminal-like domain-containing protein, partial [Planctomycetota bacterium]|nr:beta-ketoacyl synthase N-terminal-like domain-containing protein [Planctomycetota bacterium]
MQSVIQSRNPRAAVITGIGVVSPIGIGREAFWTSLANGRSGVSPLNFDSSSLNIHIGGQILDFDPKQYVRPRKSLKVMAPEIQYAFAASDMAMADAKLKIGEFAPERLGVLFGADMIHCEVEEVIEAYRVCQ